MLTNHKLKEPDQAALDLFETLWATTNPKDLPPFLIEALASVEIITATAEFKGLKLQPLEREVELAWEVKIKGRV